MKVLKVVAHNNKFDQCDISTSPCIVFGRDEKGIFISTKSYFNKTPIKCYSIVQIAAAFPSGLAHKLVNIFRILQEETIHDNNVYMADLMFDEPHWGSFKPNVVKYQVYAKHRSKQQIGLALHTQIAGKIPFEPSAAIWLASSEPLTLRVIPTAIIDYDLEVDEAMERFNNLHDGYLIDLVNWNFRTKDSLEFSNDVVAAHRSALLTKRLSKLKTQAGIDRALAQEEQFCSDISKLPIIKIADHYDRMQMWSDYLYVVLNQAAQAQIHYPSVWATIDDSSFQHEGYVIETPSCTFKVVNRNVFTKANNALNNGKKRDEYHAEIRENSEEDDNRQAASKAAEAEGR
jgi:hypothetical protein